MRRDVILERFFTGLISGDRNESRRVLEEILDADCEPVEVISRLFWPTLERIQNLYRSDEISAMAHHYSTRLLRAMVDQMQMRLPISERLGKKAMVLCGPEESEELGAQMTSDLLEAAGYDVYFSGGGIANDEIVEEIGKMNTDLLVVFGVTPSAVPFTRLLIDQLRSIGVCPNLQIAVGGGVFNRAEGLAQEIGADLWALTPEELCQRVLDEPAKRMDENQRTVGRRRRKSTNAAA